MMILTQLEKFRQGIYDSLGKARDAVFELMDAVLTRVGRGDTVHTPRIIGDI